MNASPEDSQRTSCTLINRVKDLDDADGWHEFFQRYQRLVLSIARRHGLEESEAEEVAQEVFSRVARTIGLFELGPRTGAFRKWLSQLTHWCALDARRKRPPEGAYCSGMTDQERSALSEHNPSGEVSDRDFHELIQRRLRQLVAPKDFQIYQMITFEGMTPTQVADHFDMRRGTVDTIICRVRQVARRELERLGEGIG